MAQLLTRAYTDDLSVAAGDEELVDSHDVVMGNASALENLPPAKEAFEARKK